ncbi:ATP-dependent DNA helicase RecQ [compost metagenome]
MPTIAFLDTEINAQHHIGDIGCITTDGRQYHGKSVKDCLSILMDSDFICGHNIIHHDLKYLKPALQYVGIDSRNVIDTLYLSPLVFPNRPYHHLVKDDKLQSEDLNNPLNDSKKAQDLFFDEKASFHKLDLIEQQIYNELLKDQLEFQGFFQFLKIDPITIDLKNAVQQVFGKLICENAPLQAFIEHRPIELAYCLALIKATERYSITPRWVLRNYPKVERMMYLLRNRPCVNGCDYCSEKLDIHFGLKEFFDYDNYRSYDGKNLQEQAVKAAVDNKSLLAVFPTGGGKSITFQVPALMSGRNEKGLTVVISPLQSLMKDQVDNLEKRGITEAVTINGLLDPIERSKSFERVEDGSASLLYIAPESLRSKTIERLLLGRRISRFVIDEAHCFSSWGQDFRVDYLYIADFIKNLQENKNLTEPIPISCFTATAKLKVIEDIQVYFRERLGLELELFTAPVKRENLVYNVSEKQTDEEKYNAVRELIEIKDCPTIIYVSRTKRASKFAKQLRGDGFNARAFHGKMDATEKTENQNAFLKGEVPIMVATSAFGMGVDKKDVGLVIHFDISDSLENYIQEAGRAGRDETMKADCHILFSEEDLNQHFVLLNQTKLNIKEIQQVWKAIKQVTKFRDSVSHSALEIARKAGWDDTVAEIETRVTMAIAALEDAGYLKRGQNVPRVFANSILAKNAQEAAEKIYSSQRFGEKEKENAVRIIKKLLSSKSRKQVTDEQAESRIDYISDHLGIAKEDVIGIVTQLREEKILADAKDLTAFIKRSDQKNKSLSILNTYGKIEAFLLNRLEPLEQVLNLKELNEEIELSDNSGAGLLQLKTILNFWAIKHWIKKQQHSHSHHHITLLPLIKIDFLREKQQTRLELAQFLVEYLYAKSLKENSKGEEILIEFSVVELKQEYENSSDIFKKAITLDDVEEALFFLSKIDAIKIEGGFMVVYNKLTVERLEKGNVFYKKEDYKKLDQYYENKVEQIHVVGEYALKMIGDYETALRFVDDYFQLNYGSFVTKHFPGSRREEIKRKITPSKFRQLIGDLSPAQLAIIDDQESKNIAVLAGPGSGKTKVLVHKLASLLLLEDVKQEQMLMLTFSRAAATEFRQRLLEIIGKPARFVEMTTFHSYCFDLCGRVGTILKSDNIVETTVKKIKDGEIEPHAITKTVLVIDEAQDMNQHEYNLVLALMEQNEEMRVIMVGDDDQAIYEFRKANSKFLKSFIEEQQAAKKELLHNYRSKSNIVDFANQFAHSLNPRLKSLPIEANQKENGFIHLVKHSGQYLFQPIVEDLIRTELSGTIAVLTHTNDEAFIVRSLLQKNGIDAKLIQSNEGFYISDMVEVRAFLTTIQMDNEETTIDEDLWNQARLDWKNQFQRSSKFGLIENLINVFEELYPKTKYKSDLNSFIRESKLDDFYKQEQGIVFVSTMHKAKGREFDSVFLLLDQHFQQLFEKEESKRLVYVALTRAKNRLHIHVNGNYLSHIHTQELHVQEDLNHYNSPDELVISLNHTDLYLDKFLDKDTIVDQFFCGEDIQVVNQRLCDKNGNQLLVFSKKFNERLEELRQQGYVLVKARVNFVVYWRKLDTEIETRIILPEVKLKKTH